VTHFLTRELGVAMTPWDLDGFELEGAEICLLEGRRGAVIVYKSQGKVISHYLVPRVGFGARPPALSPRDRIGEWGAGSPAVVTWATDFTEQALVGDLAPEDLMRAARTASSLE
jgi:anti-sigma factor RsiW